MSKLFRGYDIRVKREGEPMRETRHAWAPQGQLPDEWEQVKQDGDVESADITLSTQRRLRADKRKFLDRYTRD